MSADDNQTLETLVARDDVTGVLLLSEELRETVTPRELSLIRQAFEAGLRFGRTDRDHSETVFLS